MMFSMDDASCLEDASCLLDTKFWEGNPIIKHVCFPGKVCFVIVKTEIKERMYAFYKKRLYTTNDKFLLDPKDSLYKLVSQLSERELLVLKRQGIAE